jgi:hypothetical protein
MESLEGADQKEENLSSNSLIQASIVRIDLMWELSFLLQMTSDELESAAVAATINATSFYSTASMI